MTRVTRREGFGLLLGSTLYAVLPDAGAQRRGPATGDWLTMVRQHHRAIATSFENLLARDDAPYERRDLQLRNLDQLLTAHSLAEETVLYPALALAGLEAEAHELYRDEAQFKILLARLSISAKGPRGERDWVGAGRSLRDAVLQHATGDEEGRLFPELHRRLTTAENRKLGGDYAREFSRVIPVIQR